MKDRNIFDAAFVCSIQQEDYFQMKTMSKLGLTGQQAIVMRVLLRNHAYSSHLERIWIGRSRSSVKPEPFQLSASMTSLAEICGTSKQLMFKVFQKLVEVKLLEHKKTKSGHIRYYVNTEQCQEYLKEWELEDGVYGTHNYVVSTISKIAHDRKSGKNRPSTYYVPEEPVEMSLEERNDLVMPDSEDNKQDIDYSKLTDFVASIKPEMPVEEVEQEEEDIPLMVASPPEMPLQRVRRGQVNNNSTCDFNSTLVDFAKILRETKKYPEITSEDIQDTIKADWLVITDNRLESLHTRGITYALHQLAKFENTNVLKDTQKRNQIAVKLVEELKSDMPKFVSACKFFGEKLEYPCTDIHTFISKVKFQIMRNPNAEYTAYGAYL